MVSKENDKHYGDRHCLQIDGIEFWVKDISPDTVEIRSVPPPESELCFLDHVQIASYPGDVTAQVKSILRRSHIGTYWIEAHVPESEALDHLQQMIERSGGVYVDYTPHVIRQDSDWYPERLLGIALPGATWTKTILNAWIKHNPGVTWIESVNFSNQKQG